LGKEHTISAHVEIPEEAADGVLVCSGGEFGGWSLFMKSKKLHFVHNYLKIQEFIASSPDQITAGKHNLSIHFTPTAKNSKPDFITGDVKLLVDGKNVANLTGIKSALNYSAMTGFGLLVARNIGTPVSQEYKVPFAFTGKIGKVEIELK
jgi:arylsulfatase